MTLKSAWLTVTKSVYITHHLTFNQPSSPYDLKPTFLTMWLSINLPHHVTFNRPSPPCDFQSTFLTMWLSINLPPPVTFNRPSRPPPVTFNRPSSSTFLTLWFSLSPLHPVINVMADWALKTNFHSSPRDFQTNFLHPDLHPSVLPLTLTQLSSSCDLHSTWPTGAMARTIKTILNFPEKEGWLLHPPTPHLPSRCTILGAIMKCMAGSGSGCGQGEGRARRGGQSNALSMRSARGDSLQDGGFWCRHLLR